MASTATRNRDRFVEEWRDEQGRLHRRFVRYHAVGSARIRFRRALPAGAKGHDYSAAYAVALADSEVWRIGLWLPPRPRRSRIMMVAISTDEAIDEWLAILTPSA